MNEIVNFNFGAAQVRTVVIHGEPWFVAKDVAEVLGYLNPQKAVNDHCKRAVRQGERIVTLHPHTRLIPESDIYRLVMKSKLPSAEQFEVWVTSEVLPTIRKTGGVYMTPQKTEELLADPDLIIGLAMQVKQIKAERDEAIPVIKKLYPKWTTKAVIIDTMVIARAAYCLITNCGIYVFGKALTTEGLRVRWFKRRYPPDYQLRFGNSHAPTNHDTFHRLD